MSSNANDSALMEGEMGVPVATPVAQEVGESPRSASRLSMDVATAYGQKAMSLVRSRVNVGPLRGLKAVFGLGEHKPFLVPGAGEISARLRHNLPFFSTNYIVLYLALVTLSVISSPLSLICVVLLGAGWWSLSRAQANAESSSVQILNAEVPTGVAYVGMLGLSIVVGSLLLSSMLSWPLWVAAPLCLAHSVTRDESELLPPPGQLEGGLPDDELRRFIGEA